VSNQQMNSICSILSLLDRDVEVILNTLSEVKTDLDKDQLHEEDSIDFSKNQAIYDQLHDIQAGDRLPRLQELAAADAGVYSGSLEDVREALRDLINGFELAPKAHHPARLQADRTVLDSLIDDCRVALRNIKRILIPLQFEQRIYQKRVGSRIDFFNDYEMELSTRHIGEGEDLRKYIIKQIKDSNLPVWVDEDVGVIYRTSGTAGRRVVSAALVFGLPLIGLVVFPLAAVSFQELGWVWNATMINYLCCFGGFVAHVVKRLVEGQGSNPLLVDILNLLDIKALRFASLGAILGMVFVLQKQFNDPFSTVSANVAVTSFIVGYTADSLSETALKRFSREVSSRVSERGSS
jgi:hypothetical protein